MKMKVRRHTGLSENSNNIQALSMYQSRFINYVMFLTLSWTDEKHHQDLQRCQDTLFPTVPSSEKYWDELSRKPVFDGKRPLDLALQMETLLSILLWLSSGEAKPHHLKSSPGFTSLQNVSIYMEAFGIKEDPLEAFQPLDERKLTRALGLSTLSHRSYIQEFNLWDTLTQHSLAIERPQSLMSIGRSRDVHDLMLSRSRRQRLPRCLMRMRQFE